MLQVVTNFEYVACSTFVQLHILNPWKCATRIYIYIYTTDAW